MSPSGSAMPSKLLLTTHPDSVSSTWPTKDLKQEKEKSPVTLSEIMKEPPLFSAQSTTKTVAKK